LNGADVNQCDILFLIRSMGRGGAERQLSLLARALHGRGLKIVVAVFYAGGALERELHDSGVEVLDLEKAGRWSNVDVIRRLMAFVRERQPRVLHSYMPTQNVMALMLRPWLARHGCAVVCGIRTALPNAWRYTKIGGAVGLLQMAFLPLAERVISNSSRALRGLEKRVTAGHGFAIPNGVECERFLYSSDVRAEQRATWRLESSAVAIGLVGRLDPQKNHRLLVDALHSIRNERPEVIVVFVGSGSKAYQEEVQAHAERLGMAPRILWAGPSDDLSAVYSALDILCLCSVTEGFPNVIAEAMCVGLPCVATDVGDVAELMGDSGWVVPSGDAHALAQALLQACDALPAWDRERPRRRMVEQFSVDKLADRTLAALAPFLGKSE
jgi:glycosyltransferase involved in cell wall biosynthesis